MIGTAAVEFLGSTPLQTRVVVRFLLGSGATDALGVLTARTASTVTVDTRRGLVEIAVADVVAAKQVPPAPAPRPRARPDGSTDGTDEQ